MARVDYQRRAATLRRRLAAAESDLRVARERWQESPSVPAVAIVDRAEGRVARLRRQVARAEAHERTPAR